jgi:hypothetical protein
VEYAVPELAVLLGVGLVDYESALTASSHLTLLLSTVVFVIVVVAFWNVHLTRLVDTDTRHELGLAVGVHPVRDPFLAVRAELAHDLPPC